MRPSRLLRETVALRDERTVVLRPIDPSDAPRLIELHSRLSFEAQYYRFFGPKPSLSPAEASYLANVDFHKRFAIVAEVETDAPSGAPQNGGEKEIVGVGRFDVNEPGSAEAAIVIRDDYQHVGLGTAILDRMREVGRGAGLKSFTAEILAENTKMIELLQAQGLEIEPAESGVVKITAPLTLPILMRTLRVVAEVADTLRQYLPGQSES